MKYQPVEGMLALRVNNDRNNYRELPFDSFG
jgi:hypothetical protein